MESTFFTTRTTRSPVCLGDRILFAGSMGGQTFNHVERQMRQLYSKYLTTSGYPSKYGQRKSGQSNPRQSKSNDFDCPDVDMAPVTSKLRSCQYRSNPTGPIVALLRSPSTGPLDQPAWITNMMVLPWGNICTNASYRGRWLLFQFLRKLNVNENQRRYESTYDVFNFSITFCITALTSIVLVKFILFEFLFFLLLMFQLLYSKQCKSLPAD